MPIFTDFFRLATKTMKILGIIPARYASTRFPGKPLADIHGKPMIRRVYEQSAMAHRLDSVVVATDDKRIAEAVRSFGGNVVMTSATHQSGTDRCREALDIVGGTFDAVVNIQGDEPFIHPSQIDQLAEMLINTNVPIATLVRRIDVAAELFNPNIVKVVQSSQGRALYFSRHPIPFQRQYETAEWIENYPYLAHVGLYAYRAEALQSIACLPPSMLEMAESLEQLRWLENGFSIGLGITEKQNIGIDTPEDLKKIANFF